MRPDPARPSAARSPLTLRTDPQRRGPARAAPSTLSPARSRSQLVRARAVPDSPGPPANAFSPASPTDAPHGPAASRTPRSAHLPARSRSLRVTPLPLTRGTHAVSSVFPAEPQRPPEISATFPVGAHAEIPGPALLNPSRTPLRRHPIPLAPHTP